MSTGIIILKTTMLKNMLSLGILDSILKSLSRETNFSTRGIPYFLEIKKTITAPINHPMTL